jgi:hypothetical protein
MESIFSGSLSLTTYEQSEFSVNISQMTPDSDDSGLMSPDWNNVSKVNKDAMMARNTEINSQYRPSLDNILQNDRDKDWINPNPNLNQRNRGSSLPKEEESRTPFSESLFNNRQGTFHIRLVMTLFLDLLFLLCLFGRICRFMYDM